MRLLVGLVVALVAPASALGQSTERVGEAVGNQVSMTPDARYVAFATSAGLYVRDRTLVHTETVLQGVALGAPVLSADGRYVAYAARVSNGADDVFVFDRLNALTTRVSVAADGTTPGNAASTTPSISGDGRYVAF